MKHPVVRWLLPILRYGLLLAAVVFLYYSVSWYDYITLDDADQTKLRLLEAQPDGFVVLRDGREEAISKDQVALIEDTDIAKIQYGVRGVVAETNLQTALLAILLFLPVPFLAGLRLVWMLGIQDVRLSLWNSIKLTFAGNFFNFALPGTTGGDVIKAYYVTRFTHHKTEAVTTIFLDRVVGLMGLMFLSSVMFFISWNQIEWDPPRYRSYLTAVLGCVWAGLTVGGLFVFSRRLRHLIRLPELAARLPAGDQLLRIGRAMVAIRHHKSLLIGSIVITIILQLFVLFAAYVMSLALGMKGSFGLYFVCVPIGFLIGAIPISPPQGFGVMEFVYVMAFTQGGLNPESAAFAFALANRLTQLVWAIPGVLVPLLGAHLPSKAELSELDDMSTNALSSDDFGGRDPSSGGSPAGAASDDTSSDSKLSTAPGK